MKGGAEGAGCFPTGRHYPGIAHLLRVVAAGLAEGFDGSLPVAGLPLASIDTETTGRKPETDRIVEIGVVLWRNGDVVARHAWLVNPGIPIPEEARAVHGISDDDVRSEPPFPQVLPELARVLEGHIPLAYNADFDRDFIFAEVSRSGMGMERTPPALQKGVEWVDPLAWARELQKSERSRALGDVCERLGIKLEQAHRATADAEAAVRVMAAFFKDSRIPETYAAFVQEQRRLARRFNEERARWRRG